MGAWRLERVVADHGHEFDKMDNTINNSEIDHHKRCTCCWVNNQELHKEDEEHVIFTCPKYNDLRKNACGKLMTDVSIMNQTQINEKIEETWWKLLSSTNSNMFKLTNIDDSDYDKEVNTLANMFSDIRNGRSKYIQNGMQSKWNTKTQEKVIIRRNKRRSCSFRIPCSPTYKRRIASNFNLRHP